MAIVLGQFYVDPATQMWLPSLCMVTLLNTGNSILDNGAASIQVDNTLLTNAGGTGTQVIPQNTNAGFPAGHKFNLGDQVGVTGPGQIDAFHYTNQGGFFSVVGFCSLTGGTQFGYILSSDRVPGVLFVAPATSVTK